MSAAVPSKLDRRGLIYGFASYAMWGLFPLYWKMLADRASMEILAHRMLWSFVFYVAIFVAFSGRGLLEAVRHGRREWGLSSVAAAFLAVNWGLYIYAVNSGRILEGSLAYFINPLMNVAVGVFLFREPFPRILKIAVAFTFLGVAARMALATEFPWIALILALTFCAYGVTKKLLTIPALSSSVLEGLVGFPFALAAVAWFQATNAVPATGAHWLLFVGGGIVTGLPLFLFSFCAQRIPYSVMGMMQFIAPSLQFLVGYWIYREEFGFAGAVSFGLIWIGVFLYLFSRWKVMSENRQTKAGS